MTPRMSGIRINPTLSGRLCFGSHEMSAYQSLCAEIPHYHEQNGSKARKKKKQKNKTKRAFKTSPQQLKGSGAVSAIDILHCDHLLSNNTHKCTFKSIPVALF